MQTFKLYNGGTIPAIGLGVFQLKRGKETVDTVLNALDCGYRLIDTARVYFNESSVGEAIKKTELKREEIFVSTKMWKTAIYTHTAKMAFNHSLKRLGLDYVDLYLLHWPVKGFIYAYKAIEELYKEGKIKAIGVSNFLPRHIERLKEAGLMLPMVNQIEVNPYYQNDETVEYCQKEDIVVEAYSPFGGSKHSCLGDATLKEIASKYHVSTAQVIVRWLYQKGIVALPRSKSINHLKSNIEIDSFELDESDMEAIKKLNQNLKSGGDPEKYN